MIGAARRIGDSIALGLSVGAAQVRVTEQRRIWAGFGGREAVGDPVADVDLVMSGTDPFAASAVAGVMYAPDDAQVELGASVAWARTAQLAGDVRRGRRAAGGPAVQYTCSTARGARRAPAAGRARRRALRRRSRGRRARRRSVARGSRRRGRRRGRCAASASCDSSQLYVDLRSLPSRIAQHTHVAVRASVDVELLPGFLWATGGYAFSTLGTPAARLSPSFADLGGHTLGLGLEATAGGVTVTLGWSRTWSLATQAPTALSLDNPFEAGDGAVPPGTYDGVDRPGRHPARGRARRIACTVT